MKRDLYDIYSYYVRKLYGKDREFFYVNYNKKTHRTCIDFLNIVSLEVGLQNVDRNYWFNYIGFQFYYLRSKQPRYVESRIPFNQIFNKSAFTRWEERNEGYLWYVLDDFSKLGIHYSDVDIQEIELRDPQEIVSQEEVLKSQYHNTEKGFSNCILFTSLYNHKSELCQQCLFSHKCKEILKKSMVSIYVDRGYVI